MKRKGKIAEIYDMPRLKNMLSMSDLKTKNLFYRIEGPSVAKVRFLVPPCMPENDKNSVKELSERYK